ncbi:MAG: efflux RND transporter periplasmic adaptor subunit [Lewinellaceae bacterium]|nr:efflux RND transporter periplasmic adaptor subunit [Saprospiraceae bacterium]MCB9315411.1 efflux RND transporter periplasmic adaptor subunit [Lewinellaceae bacterium]MCB9331087.1 efflux RND transporter periplasmic adaptor subunit [Lewinellaceae bacterium]
MKTFFRISLITTLTLALAGGTIWTLFAKREHARQEADAALKTVATAVKVITVETSTVAYSLDAVGKAEPSAEAAIIAENPGRITELYMREGATVTRGHIVAETDAQLHRISLEAAESSLRQAERTLTRLEKLKAENNVTEAEWENAVYTVEQARANVATCKERIEDSKILAPISGVVTKRNVEQGSVIQPGQSLAQLTNVAELKIAVPLPEQDITKIKNGQLVQVTFDALPGKTTSGRVFNIAVVADEAGRFDVEVAVSNTSGQIRSGMSARVQFSGTARKNVVTIPKTALISLAATPSVFIINTEGKAELRAIEVGSSVGRDLIEVHAGLQSGDRLVVKGQDNLEDGDSPNF